MRLRTRAILAPLLLLAPLVLLASTGLAAEPTSEPKAGVTGFGFGERLQIHGFASQGAVQSSANRYYGDSPETSFDFTELGINASFRVNPRLMLAAQVLSRRAGDMSDGSPEIDFALADINLVSNARYRAGMRVGRIKNRLGLYNETRDVPFTHPGIFLPQVVYFDKVRNLVLSTDGILLYGDLHQPFGTFSATLSTGNPVIDENVEAAYMSGDFDGTLESENHSWLASLWFDSATEALKLGLSGATASAKYHPNSSDPFSLQPGTIDIIYWIASAQYNAERWSLTAEYMGEPMQWRDFGPWRPDRDATAEGYYAQGTYRFLPRWQLMARYEEGFANRDDRDGSQLERDTFGMAPANTAYSRILSLGVRWDINRQWMLRAEYSRHIGNFILSEIENPDFSQFEKHWNVFAIQAAFRF
ncbi:TonB-dependent receptor [Thiorhodovibrio frisius]|uniref:Phosphate-selective porin O and P n=1 Tax=Thiorhodovibrio frisius TaxID=631362 RepID=H8YXJ4_9GAMM|nr:TonB-dependent receptor [Thiorhodovibrio frisius]EIC23170.1 hypothetical protein Thi970DRAFT_00823 [Thiorhodovibrio frisius]WPL22559.1 hypothetical protein Thiofri_02726 [Thiorhodovibrio frisius]